MKAKRKLSRKLLEHLRQADGVLVLCTYEKKVFKHEDGLSTTQTFLELNMLQDEFKREIGKDRIVKELGLHDKPKDNQ